MNHTAISSIANLMFRENPSMKNATKKAAKTTAKKASSKSTAKTKKK